MIEPRMTDQIQMRSRLRRRNQELPIHKMRKKVKRTKYIKCHIYGCSVNNQARDENGELKYKHIKFHNVPKFPAELKGKSPRILSVAHRHVKIFHRREMLRRMRLDEDDKKGQYVICENHRFSHETHWVNVKHGNKSWSQRCKLTLSENVGP